MSGEADKKRKAPPADTTGHGIGYGKTILFGEHFVVYGFPAIAAAIAMLTTADVVTGEPGTGLTLIDNRIACEGYKDKKQGEITRGMDLILKYMKIDIDATPLKITLAGDLQCASGIGASAALASSVARALSEYFSLDLNDDEVNDVAYEGEKGSAGTPSGVDNTCSTYGGTITFTKNLAEGGKNKIEQLQVGRAFDIVMFSTGITQETAVVVGEVRALKEANPAQYKIIFDKYQAVYDAGLVALAAGDTAKVGALMDDCQALLAEITVSCPEIERIIKIAKDNGAIGAKLTGTGRGGLVIALSPDAETTSKMLAAAKAEGIEGHATTIGKSKDATAEDKKQAENDTKKSKK